MGIWEHQTEFDGKPVQDYQPGMTLEPETNNYRLRLDYDAEISFDELLAQFLASPNADAVTGLLTGSYSEEMYEDNMSPVVEAVIAASDQLSALTGIFFGDIIAEENEISWILQTDISPVWQAYPRLRTLQVRGAEGLSLGEIVHDQLQTLIVECGGLQVEIVHQVAKARLPELTHLELYLGDSGYGGTSTIDDIRPLLNKELFPKLRVLGLKNCEYQDAVVEAVVESSLAEQIEVLDFSLGVMSDDGAQKIVSNIDRLKSLKSLDASYNFLTDAGCAALQSLAVEVDTSDQKVDDDYNYVSVGE